MKVGALVTIDETKVLVVEDDLLIRMATVISLEDAGFAVFEAANFNEAMALLKSKPLIQAIFTDIDMLPGLNGLELAMAVRRRWPAIKIMITSGHRHIQNEDLPVIGRFFRKPYDPKLVANALREMTSAA